MKLYFSPGACSLAPHIVLRESGSTFDLERIDLKTHTTADGSDYYQVNSKGAVPVLATDDGQLLTEGPVICQYIADTAGNTQLMPAAGTPARYRVMEWQNYITSEVHKSFSPLFNPAADAATKALFRSALRKKYEWIDARLGAGPYLTGTAFTAADAYLFTVTRWAKGVDVDLSGLASLGAFMERVNARPAVRAAIETEAASGTKN
jgi:glutathione S-transferase